VEALDYKNAKNFVLFMVARLYGHMALPEADTPAGQIKKLEAKSASLASKGVAMALSDILTATWRMPSDDVHRLDEELRSAGHPTLSSMRRKHWKRYKTILGRKHIRDEIEYEIIKAMVDDTDEVTEEERLMLQRMLSSYDGT